MVYIDGDAETQSLPEPESSEGGEGEQKINFIKHARSDPQMLNEVLIWEQNALITHTSTK